MSDREIIRELAKRYKEIAVQDIMKERALLYRRLNGLNPIRPVVLVDEIPWNQLEKAEGMQLQCEGEKERCLESYLRRELYRFCHFACDRIAVDYIPWQRHITIGSFGIDIHEDILAFDNKNSIVAHRYIDQLPDEAAVEKLHVPEITIDEEADKEDEEWLNELLGDILPVKMTALEYATFFEPWDNIAEWRGVETLLWDLMDRPEFMLQLVRKITDVRLAMLEKVEQMNLLDNNSPFLHSTPGLTNELPGGVKNGQLTRKNVWGRGAAQIFSNVSPAMLEEFEIPFVKEYFKDFGLVYYGCCEPLDKRIHIVREIPNLRKISITPWADVDNGAAQIGCDFVMANKPNPAYLAVDHLDEELIRKETKRTLDACKRNNTPVELVLKDISSINYHPENLDLWAKTVMEMVLGQD
ncbi:MAG: hypothetical protein ACOX8M_01680 [Marvinbryantia sp.]|jgi:hypothetical protein